MKKYIYVVSSIIVISQSCEKPSTAQHENPNNNLHKSLRASLDTILFTDQAYRAEIQSAKKQFGIYSVEFKTLESKILEMDSINIIKVGEILDKYGWLSEGDVGDKGNEALFLVLQHADLNVQEKYLPMLREAVKNNKAKAKHLAYLEDRVALRKGEKQTYGSQFIVDFKTGIHYVSPIKDPDNVDKRRKEIGLDSMQKNAKRFNIIWNVAQYKKDLPHVQALEKEALGILKK